VKWASRFGWISRNYDTLALAVVMVAIAVSAVHLAGRVSALATRLERLDQPVRARPEQGFQELDLTLYSNALAQLENPIRVGEGTNRMFMSELRVFCIQCGKWIPFTALQCPFCKAEQPPPPSQEADSDKDGLPDVWEEARGLDPYNPDDARLDHDGDGFSTLEEYRAGTDPRNASSAPPVLTKLRLKEIRTQSFRLRFVAIQRIPVGGRTQEVFQVNARTLERSYFVRIGQTVEGYTVESYDPATDTLTLRKGDTVKRLGRGKIIDDDQLIVHLVFLLDGTVIVTRVGEEFQVRDQTAVVKEIAADRKSVMIATPDGKSFPVTFPTSEEEMEMRLRMSAPWGAGAPVESPQGGVGGAPTRGPAAAPAVSPAGLPRRDAPVGP
jgi:hypothetical protein